ncbi:MAG: TIGR03905 family TSCPD domain-containing protein [Clostridia bacterium]|nr:TIGR03905 family TSCPD domain-containing protein [Clostridia bacterium]
MRFNYKTSGVCAMLISFDINDDIISNVEFLGGCNGNLKAISKLVEGKSVDYIESVLKGNLCGNKGTSCADQLALAVRAASNSMH